ncbi:unnamed protein product [Aphis gossypii]|uniref:C2H2-type domain-containing protein n=1 Tax=Aphis gossypii TaxID=80765 RepID=A0A9P0NRG3_APHGO|nr:unnamed protein product [Aphis gossypii]
MIKCELCKFSFIHKDVLNIYEKIHSGLRFLFTEYTVTFKNKCNCTWHKRTFIMKTSLKVFVSAIQVGIFILN